MLGRVNIVPQNSLSLPKMKFMYRVACTILVLGVFLKGAAGDETQEDEFKTEVHENGDEAEITILDKDGQVVGIVDWFEDEGYQIDKPTDGEEHVCLLRKIDEVSEEDNETDVCYKRSLLSQTEVLETDISRILDHCENRTIYILQPQDCDRIYTTETAAGRKKRSWPHGNYCCHYKTYTSVKCVRVVKTSKCCKKIFGICIRRCTRCVTYSTTSYTQLLCHYG